MKIRLLPAAERDLEIGGDFYERQSPGLGEYFTGSLSADIDALRFFAGIHEQYRGFHRSLATRFPYSIYYRVSGEWVEVYAVLDARLDPRKTDAALVPRADRG